MQREFKTYSTISMGKLFLLGKHMEKITEMKKAKTFLFFLFFFSLPNGGNKPSTLQENCDKIVKVHNQQDCLYLKTTISEKKSIKPCIIAHYKFCIIKSPDEIQ